MSNIFGTRITVSRDSGRVLTVRVRIAGGTPGGIHKFTIVFAHGERTTVHYRQR
jgi:hypothetical protein